MEVCRTYSEWVCVISQLYLKLAWFGENVLPTASSERRPRERLTLDDEQRILLSWLAGGSASQVARRAAVTRRTVYTVLRRKFYVGNPVDFLGHWFDLGLISVLITPCYLEEPSTEWQDVVCLVCHRQICPYRRLAGDLPVGTLLRPGLVELRDISQAEDTADEVQAHLLLHFWLDEGIRWGRLMRALLGTDAWSAVPDRVYDWDRGDGAGPPDFINWPTVPGASRDENEWRRWRRQVLARKGGQAPDPPARSTGEPVDVARKESRGIW